MKSALQVARLLLRQGDAEQCRKIGQDLLEQGGSHALNADGVLIMLSARDLLSEALLALGKFTEARQELTHVIEARTALLRKGHPAILTSRYHLAKVFRSPGDHNRARRELRSLQALTRAYLPTRHPLTIKVQEGLDSLDSQ
jgi:hypothetical protein